MFGPTEARLIDDTGNPLGIDQRAAASQDDIVTINEITVPINRTVRIRLRSKDAPCRGQRARSSTRLPRSAIGSDWHPARLSG